jgi:hypothetical protein
MDIGRKQDLIHKFNAQQLTGKERTELESLIESGEIGIEELASVAEFEKAIKKIEFPEPSRDLDDQFYQMLALQKRSKGTFSWSKFFAWEEFAPKFALAAVMLVIGVTVGYLVRPSVNTGQNDMQTLTQEVVNLKEMMMLSLLEKESATERLKAVSLTEDMNDASSKVTNALIRTLNEDENVNVRLAALDALHPYAKNSDVRQALIKSIEKQNSALVQIALAEFMVAIQEKSSVKEFEKIIESERTPAEVKSKIKESIKILI